jgi:DNA-binding NtrC family response regulator
MSRTRKIFVVDDDPAFAEMLSEHLKANPLLDVRIYDTGEEALKHLDEEPDLVILDHTLNMRHHEAADGLHILHRMRHVVPDIKVVMLSAQDSYGTALKTVAGGALEYIVKDERAFARVDSLIKNLA